jgi:hypothetical protein
MRLVVMAGLLILLFAAPAAAVSAYDDVPLDHWAYEVLDCLIFRGVLQGYPADFFDGHRQLTRFEFAQAVCRILDKPGLLGTCSDDVADVARLQTEFAAELALPMCEYPSTDGGLQSTWTGPPAVAPAADEPPVDSIETLSLSLWTGIEASPAPAEPRTEEVPVWETPLAGIPVGNAAASNSGLDYRVVLLQQGDGSLIWQMRVVNTGDQAVVLSFDTNERCDFRAWDGKILCWNCNNNRFFVQAPVRINLLPGPEHALEFRSHPWRGEDNTGMAWVDAPGGRCPMAHCEAVVLLSSGPVTLGFDAELP